MSMLAMFLRHAVSLMPAVRGIVVALHDPVTLTLTLPPSLGSI